MWFVVRPCLSLSQKLHHFKSKLPKINTHIIRQPPTTIDLIIEFLKNSRRILIEFPNNSKKSLKNPKQFQKKPQRNPKQFSKNTQKIPQNSPKITYQKKSKISQKIAYKSLFHLLFTEIFCTMGYRNFCSKASVQKFLCPIVQKNVCEK